MTCKDKKTRVSLLVVTKAALPFSPTYLSSKNAMNSPACNILQLSDSINYFKASLVLSRAERRGEASEAKDKPNCAYRARIPFPSVRSHDTRGSKRRSQREKESDEKQISLFAASTFEIIVIVVACFLRSESDSGRCQNQSGSNAIQISKRRGGARARARAHAFDLTRGSIQ